MENLKLRDCRCRSRLLSAAVLALLQGLSLCRCSFAVGAAGFPAGRPWRCKRDISVIRGLPSAAWLAAFVPSGANADGGAEGGGFLLKALLLMAGILWLAMLGGIGLQLGGAEPGVESTYWWLSPEAAQGESGTVRRRQPATKRTEHVAKRFD
eukprot:TRINITY_DN26635_c0_g1_i1.p1 TRINITY_DN26635_c0_g1~~TRINITY_DN26635_c0_g1_i1.p1  ORF type:complete len:153 (-),score=24.37 TRINITY_DN26635_c0_g1_i1:21-479(-)